jgi:predicted DNA-binding transcriptional regulator AlpA
MRATRYRLQPQWRNQAWAWAVLRQQKRRAGLHPANSVRSESLELGPHTTRQACNTGQPTHRLGCRCTSLLTTFSSSLNDKTSERLCRMTGDTLNIIPELLTTAESARLCNVGERTLWRWSRSGTAPPPIRIGGRAVRYRRDELLRWIADGCPRVDGRINR